MCCDSMIKWRGGSVRTSVQDFISSFLPMDSYLLPIFSLTSDRANALYTFCSSVRGADGSDLVTAVICSKLVLLIRCKDD